MGILICFCCPGDAFFNTKWLTKHVLGTYFVKIATPIISCDPEVGILFASQSVHAFFSCPFVLHDIFFLAVKALQEFFFQNLPPPLKSRWSTPKLSNYNEIDIITIHIPTDMVEYANFMIIIL